MAGVTTQHTEYAAHTAAWQRCRDAFAGGDAIKARSESYLPKLSGQTPQEYGAYKTRALWYNATARTVQGLLGAVFRKAPTVELPESLRPHLDDMTLGGVSFESFARLVVQEVLVTGRYGVLVDLPPEGAPDQRPYWAGYSAESIVNWRAERRQAQMVLTLVVLQETAEAIDETDAFALKRVPQYRVLSLDAQGQYTVALWQQDPRRVSDASAWIIVQTFQPTQRGAPLAYIPFGVFGPSMATPPVEKPPLLDLVDLNLSHYRSSADLEHGRHFCGLPTPWVAGFPADLELKIGASTAWVSNDPKARAGMLEFTGRGLGALEKALEEKEAKMAALGARLLEEQKKSVEAAAAIRLRQSGEQSVLQALAASISHGLTKALQWHVVWAGGTSEAVHVALNSDFVDVAMTPQELTALVGAWQSSALSYETLHYNLVKGEMMRPGIDAETERQLIEAQRPVTVPLGEEV